jgi:hypothetical protein
VEECGSFPVFASLTLAFALQMRKKHGKTSVRERKTSVTVQYTYYQNTHTLQNPHKHTNYKKHAHTHTHTHTHIAKPTQTHKLQNARSNTHITKPKQTHKLQNAHTNTHITKQGTTEPKEELLSSGFAFAWKKQQEHDLIRRSKPVKERCNDTVRQNMVAELSGEEFININIAHKMYRYVNSNKCYTECRIIRKQDVGKHDREQQCGK